MLKGRFWFLVAKAAWGRALLVVCWDGLLVLMMMFRCGISSPYQALTKTLLMLHAQVGMMDIDICGPSLPLMFGLSDSRLHSTSSGILPLSVLPNLSLVSIGFLLPTTSSAVIWRGPKKNGIIKQFLKDVDWGELDYLVVDTPPGTSDEHLSVVQYLKESGIDGAVIVTTPQEVALQDVRKELDFCRKVGVPILGVIENMSGFVCPSCGGESDIFIPSTGGAEQMAKEWGVELLGKVPLDPRIGKSCDFGVSFLDEYPESPASVAYLNIVDRMSFLHVTGEV